MDAKQFNIARTLVSLTFVFMFFSFSMAQETNMGLSIELNGGLSNPMSEYTEYTVPSLGFAQKGGIAGLGLNYGMKKNVGIGIGCVAMWHSVDANALAEQLWEENKTASKISVTAGSYMVRNPHVSLYKDFEITSKLNIRVKFGVGMMIAKSPDITETITTSPPVVQEIKPAVSSALSIQPELGIHCALSETIGIGLFGNYIQSTPTFEFVQNEVIIAAEQKIQVLNIGLRIRYNLHKSDDSVKP
jgi:hypothetical protein